jgi:hypothetical protein
MPQLRHLAVIVGLALAVSPALVACSADAQEDGSESVDGTEEPLTSVTDAEVSAAQRTALDPSLHFDLLTPTGEKMMKSSWYWMGVQDRYSRYPKARMCASNVSKVLFLSQITRYDQEGVRNLIADVGGSGGKTFKMSQNKAKFIEQLNQIHGGHIPAGTLVAGESIHSSNPGDQHVGLIGHTDADGVIWVYNNNWYRPENEGGARKPYMVSDANLRRGFPRQWMGIPWLKVTRDASGKVSDVKTMIPAIDDMDPFNPGYAATLAIPQEIANEL